MLDNITKKNIDDCRDVLVGKVPDPKSQIEQITLALIYKFMDDMDKEAVEVFKGKAKFFVGDFAKYGWRKLFDPSLGGKEMLELYSEALDKLQTNGNIPELFRNIFKNAFLPYKDPNTLRLFLKYINEFEYTHSEKLGDAFEYLLSVMSSQGDAGQFRTPRHIIDFIVACLDPKKNETIGDPACGTAGFLLSAYKYIVQQNTQKRLGDQLTPDQRKKMANNIIGYDISPDMVRLSLVNMYLHGFATPQIYEYDTLSSEDRWNETFDVVLANPPFMTPKGGIRPHKKFGVQANKAEVLFTDYIAEHLNKNGRAGIVVPNGIVATTQTAYKQLRKLLVEDSLIAVISLPAGCFNPYSGVKTSILMLDKGLAKKSKEVLFIKVNNDGYDLGAQRREIDKNDLPTALKAFNDFKQHLTDDSDFIPENYNDLCLLVEKEKILENKDVVLSGDRYKESDLKDLNYDILRLGDVCDFEGGSQPPKSEFIYEKKEGYVRFVQIRDFGERGKETYIPINKRNKLCEERDVLIGRYGASIGRICSGLRGAYNVALLKCIPDNNKIDNRFLYQLLNFDKIQRRIIELSDRAAQAGVSPDDLKEFEIPLPPLSIQEEIVKEIEGYQKIIDGAKMVVENYKPTITINPDWEMVELGEVCEINPPKSEVRNLNSSTMVSFLPMADLNENESSFIPKDSKKLTEVIGGYTYFKDGDVILAKVTPCFENGKAGIANNLINGLGFGSSEFFILRPKVKVLSFWIYIWIKTPQFANEGKKQMSGTSGLQRLPKNFISTYKIPVPSIDEQQLLISQISKEQNHINSAKELISIFEQKIKDRINAVWGVGDNS